MSSEAMLYNTLPGSKVECLLCAHKCVIPASTRGICGVRENIGGKLFTLADEGVVASNVDPIGKKPLYHFLPGSNSYSIAAAGCNFKCGFCQNWQISQAIAKGYEVRARRMSPEDIVDAAKRSGCASISYTYTEPTVFFELAHNTAKLARKEELRNVFVTNGYMSREALDLIKPYLDAANVDLKSFSDHFYKKYCAARLEPVLDTIRYMKE
ncbi:MAG: radical SAM protein, partial [Candidatus Omnitrophota bacterium]